jgi:hypothetical protein
MVRAGAEPLGSGLRKSDLSKPRWALRDSLASLGLFLATACVVLWQNAHVAVLWDTSYVLDSAVRFAHGQAPYRHFPFVHPPLTFLIQAAIIRFTGRVFFHHVLYAAAVGGLGTVLTWRLALATLRGRARAAWVVALLVAAPLAVLGIYSIIPIPEYDGDCTFWILIALWLLQRADAKRSIVSGLAAGVGLCVPLFCKQNMGLPFLAAAVGAVLLVLALALMRMRRGQASAEAPEALTLLSILAAACATLFAAVLALHWTAGIRNYVHWTIRFAGERRLPGFGAMLAIFRDPSLLWTLPCVAAALLLLRLAPLRLRWARIAAFALLAAPFLFALASLLIYDDADERGDSLLALWPLLLLLAAVSAIWPLLALLVAEMLASLRRFTTRAASPWFVPALAALISITLLICGGFYTASEDRLSYVNLPYAPVEHSAFPQLAGMTTPGPYLPELDELLRYAQANIPQDDGLILIPGEDPFYFATGRVPRFPVLLFDPTTDPYSPAEIAALVRSQSIRWLIVKRDLQIIVDPTPNRAATMQALMGEFTQAARLRGYDVYRR